jgi:hypothetical protein
MNKAYDYSEGMQANARPIVLTAGRYLRTGTGRQILTMEILHANNL